MANWIAKATANSHGQFKRKAKRAGVSTAVYAKRVTKKSSRASAKTKKQANLAKNLAKARRGKKG